MDRVLIILNKFFRTFFVSLPDSSSSLLGYILRWFRIAESVPLLAWGAIFLIIGFVVGILRRIIHS